MLKATPAFKRLVLANEVLHAAAGPFSGALDALKLTLSTTPIPEDVDIVFDDSVTEPTYAGYAAQTVVWGAVYKRGDGRFGITGPLLTFQELAALTGQVIRACCLYLTGVPNDVMFVKNFPEAMNMATADDVVKVLVELALGGDDWGDVAVIDT